MQPRQGDLRHGTALCYSRFHHASSPTPHAPRRAELESIWKDVLLYQFHDVLPGSSIGRVYDVTKTR